MKQKTPQEKEALSYARDCRNTYGENDKGSRKTIRKNKTIQNQVYRRKINQVLNEIEDTKLESVELVEGEAKAIKKGKWKKCSDTPLNLFIELQKDMSRRRVGRKTRGDLLKSNLDDKFMSELKKRK